MDEQQQELQRQIRALRAEPGVYQFLDHAGKILYVGKARNLKQRVASYLRTAVLSPKTRALMERARGLRITLTRNEIEALLLEQNLIKNDHPPYNILLRDDKSYPFIFVSEHADFPYIGARRGKRKRGGQFFGPYPNAATVHKSINSLQKIFKIRTCRDSYFRHRTRPCLQYEIGRCSAPCTGKISREAYQNDLQHVRLFLQHKSDTVIRELEERMQRAAAAEHFEQAAEQRDRIRALQALHSGQRVDTDSGDADVVCTQIAYGVACVLILFVRDGQVLSHRHYFPALPLDAHAASLCADFIAQFYLSRPAAEIPAEIIVDPLPEDWECLQAALQGYCQHPITLRHRVRTHRASWLQLAQRNLAQSLEQACKQQQLQWSRLEALQRQLRLPQLPALIECFDIAHIQGDFPVAACVALDTTGMNRSRYRRFHLRDITPGDDYAAINQAVTRCYRQRLQRQDRLPAIILIDGGRGQLNAALSALRTLAVRNVYVLGIAKGEGRKSGLESLWFSTALVNDNKTFSAHHWAPNDAALLLLIQLRDEAHRFANSGHRKRRGKQYLSSVLEQINGVGRIRRRALLTRFGSLNEIAHAPETALAQVPGVSRQLAQKIHAALADYH